MQNIGLIFLVIFWIVCVTMFFTCVKFCIKLIRQQRDLKRSVTVVQLKHQKWLYIVSCAILVITFVYIILQISDGNSPTMTKLERLFDFERFETIIILSPIALMFLSLIISNSILIFTKAAISADGLYTGFDRINWTDVKEYIIDEVNSALIVTKSRSEFLTFFSTTPLLKMARNDISKAIFVLNKNKSKFKSNSVNFSQKVDDINN